VVCVRSVRLHHELCDCCRSGSGSGAPSRARRDERGSHRPDDARPVQPLRHAQRPGSGTETVGRHAGVYKPLQAAITRRGGVTRFFSFVAYSKRRAASTSIPCVRQIQCKRDCLQRLPFLHLVTH
jgi:hypothetical protein